MQVRMVGSHLRFLHHLTQIGGKLRPVIRLAPLCENLLLAFEIPGQVAARQVALGCTTNILSRYSPRTRARALTREEIS